MARRAYLCPAQEAFEIASTGIFLKDRDEDNVRKAGTFRGPRFASSRAGGRPDTPHITGRPRRMRTTERPDMEVSIR